MTEYTSETEYARRRTNHLVSTATGLTPGLLLWEFILSLPLISVSL